ncbi:DUF4097 domain-containing protein [Halorubellus salinus]|uniref:DUF4097 domain-containing protein n=1 Tax=Halorubellus salinus TaxID=755309 RepID=UPI001D0805F0|nr:DUF4097 domain-containing protein [Halorubellus salinus]
MEPLGFGRRRERGRAAAPVVGVVLMLGLVVAGAGLVYATGMDAKASVQDASAADGVETSLQAAGATFASVAHTGSGATELVDLGDSARDVRVEADGRLRVQVNGRTACTAATDLGTVVADTGSGVTVAYQAGAIFRRSASGTTILQSPALEYRTEHVNGHPIRTVSFPVPNVTGDVDGREFLASADRAGDTIQDDLCLTDDGAADLEYVREVTITVAGSDHYRAWHRYFEREFGAVADHSVDHGTKTASVTAPLGAGVHPDQFTFEGVQVYGAIFSTASSGELLLQTQHATVDSYDSRDGPWGGATPTYDSGGTVMTRGSVAVQANGATIAGNVYAEGSVSLSESCGSGGDLCVTEDVYVNNSTASGPVTALQPSSPSERAERIGGTRGNGTQLPVVPPMDATIDRTVATASTYNTNDNESAIDVSGVQYTASSATVESGVYYLDELTVPAGTDLTLDTTDGDVVLAIAEDVDIGADATVTVKGDGQVHAFVGESTTAGDQLFVGEGTTVRVLDGGTRTYRSNALVVACKSGCGATFADAPSSNPTTFTGVLYAPGNAADDGTISLGKRVDVWGALVGGTVTFEQQAEFHFDESLRNQVATDDDGDGAPDVTTAGLSYVDPPIENGYVISVTYDDVNVTDGSARIARGGDALASSQRRSVADPGLGTAVDRRARAAVDARPTPRASLDAVSVA